MSWFDWLPTVLNAASSIYGDVTKTAANNQAAQIKNSAQTTATQQETAGLDQAIASYNASKANDQALQAQAAPGVNNQQTAIAQQNTLTPAQQNAITVARQQATQGLATSGLSGSGRALVATQNQLNTNLTDQFLQQNRQRADTAGSALSGQYFNAGQNLNTQNSNIAGAQEKVGQVGATGTAQIGATNANTVQGNAGLNASTATGIASQAGPAAVSGSALGDINSMIAQQNKTRSSYGANAVGGQAGGSV